jgi:hypothetical protein
MCGGISRLREWRNSPVITVNLFPNFWPEFGLWFISRYHSVYEKAPIKILVIQLSLNLLRRTTGGWGRGPTPSVTTAIFAKRKSSPSVTTQEFPLKPFKILISSSRLTSTIRTLSTKTINLLWSRARLERFQRPSGLTFAALILELLSKGE